MKDVEKIKIRRDLAEAYKLHKQRKDKLYHQGWFDALEWVMSEHEFEVLPCKKKLS